MSNYIKTLIRSIIFSIFIIIASSCSYTNNQILNADIINSVTITNVKINEASGIAVSRIQKNIVWIINDSGNSTLVFAVNSKGNHLGTLNIQGVKNNDWEDMASFKYKNKSYILIADVGDNKAKREKYFLHFIQEPNLEQISHHSLLSIKPSWSIAFTYEDGPRDCEAVAVDIVNEKVLLLSKRDSPPVLYELPLNSKKIVVAQKIGPIKPLPQAKQNDIRKIKYYNFTTQPTAMDISADNLSVIVLTYVNAYYYNLEKSSDWSSAFLNPPKEIVLPFMQQAESVCFDNSGTSIYVTSEKIPAPLHKVNLTKFMKKSINHIESKL